MKKKLLPAILFMIALYSAAESDTKKNLTLVEEDKSFWDTLLNEKSINNKNLLYASYIAYKDRLNDLSIETFQECIKSNLSNSVITGIINYYIGKNLFLIGKYEEAITQFSIVENYDLAKYAYIKFSSQINTAISYYQLGNTEKFREYLQKVISSDNTGIYKKQALNILTIVQ